jgi:hypothetical protein
VVELTKQKTRCGPVLTMLVRQQPNLGAASQTAVQIKYKNANEVVAQSAPHFLQKSSPPVQTGCGQEE